MRVLQSVKRLLRAQFPNIYAHLATAYNERIKRYGVVSYAQEGEDLRFLPRKTGKSVGIQLFG